MGHPSSCTSKVIFESDCKVLQDLAFSRINLNRTYMHGGVVNECKAHAHGLLEVDMLPTR